MVDGHESKLGRDVFLALAALAWSDGRLDDAEADAIVRTAVEEGLEIEQIAEIEQAIRGPVTLDQIDIGKLSKADRLFVYAVGAWLTRLDGSVGPAEREALDRIGDLLRIPARPREHAEEIAREVGEKSDGETPLLYDLPRLRRTLQIRLGVAQQLRGASRPPPAGNGSQESEGAGRG